jgi:WD40 repeat protein
MGTSDVVGLPSGERVVSASWDNAIRVYSSANGECWRALHGHAARVESLAALGGDIAVSIDESGDLRLWYV